MKYEGRHYSRKIFKISHLHSKIPDLYYLISVVVLHLIQNISNPLTILHSPLASLHPSRELAFHPHELASPSRTCTPFTNLHSTLTSLHPPHELAPPHKLAFHPHELASNCVVANGPPHDSTTFEIFFNLASYVCNVCFRGIIFKFGRTEELWG